MDNNNQITNYKISLKGQLTVNLPVALIIFFCLFFFTIVFDFSFKIAVLIGFLFSWIYWTYAVKSWIKWAVLEKNVDKDRLYKIGKYGLLIWNKDHIIQVIENKKKPWI